MVKTISKPKWVNYLRVLISVGFAAIVMFYYLPRYQLSLLTPEERVARLLKIQPVIDTHNDLPMRMRNFQSMKMDNLTNFQTDLPRLRKGGIGAQFWSGYISCNPNLNKKMDYIKDTLGQIDVIKRMVRSNPSLKFVTRADEIMPAFKDGKIASLIGLEGGHQIDNSLAALRQFYDLGVRYMTLTHSCNTHWADSSTDDHVNNGLSEFGKHIVKEMNRVGMMVDISHVSHKVMKDVVELSEAPLFASHSNAYSLCAKERNMPDHILKAMKDKDGVIMINFWPEIVSCQMPASLVQVADHISYIASLIGTKHIGFGADFDGIVEPTKGLEDVSKYPDLLIELAKRGFSDEDLLDIMGRNIIRILRKTELLSESLQYQEPDPLKIKFNQTEC